ncbi:MAG: hypothetical protein BA865_12460 [Desulfobacterales bacterium S5133MH4]|nr:MAG: hypothetical protein BA865_12460 [Desulfobacterales bacterium S5133MH4]
MKGIYPESRRLRPDHHESISLLSSSLLTVQPFSTASWPSYELLDAKGQESEQDLPFTKAFNHVYFWAGNEDSRPEVALPEKKKATRRPPSLKICITDPSCMTTL